MVLMTRDIVARRRYAMSVVLNIVVFLSSGGTMNDVYQLRHMTPVMILVLLLTATGAHFFTSDCFLFITLLLAATVVVVHTTLCILPTQTPFQPSALQVVYPPAWSSSTSQP